VIRSRREGLHGGGPLLAYFACIGLGFMFVEISQMQRLILFLGHPIYGLSVILFSLLLSGGLGSYLTSWVGPQATPCAGVIRLLLLLGVMVLFGLATPRAVTGLEDQSTPIRIAAAAGILFGLGLFMGMAFPLGMRLAEARTPQLTAWFWGVNGATSVLASVLAVGLALTLGISPTFLAGVSFLLGGLGVFVWGGRGGLLRRETPSR